MTGDRDMKQTIAIIAAVLIAVPALGDVYTWRDENGVLHYGDMPPENGEATIVPLQTRRTDNAAVTARANAQREARTATSEAIENAESAQAAERAAATLAADEREAACTAARERLRNYINARRLYRTNEAGEREYLDSAEITSARANAEADVADKCRGS
ncbi:MAG: DUF4124 domain-containing protein [Pseudomonadota bacterium]